MSGAVGSIPSLPRSRRPDCSLRSSSPSGRQSTALRASHAACSAASPAFDGRALTRGLTGGLASDPMLEFSPPFEGPPAPGRDVGSGVPPPDSCRRPPPRPGAGYRAPPDQPRSEAASRKRMSDTEDNPPERPDLNAPIPFEAPKRQQPVDESGRPVKPRLRTLRVLSVVIFVGLLAFVSTLFGMLTAVASDLPQIENRRQFGTEHNSYLFDDMGRP